MSLHETVRVVSTEVHLSAVPSTQVRVRVCNPGPHDFPSPLVLHVTVIIHSPTIRGQSGSSHGILCSLSSTEHFLNVPSMQFWICAWRPGPHDLLLCKATQEPLFFQPPYCITMEV